MIEINLYERAEKVPIAFLPFKEGARTFVFTDDVRITLSNEYVLHIPRGFETDLMSIPRFGWSLFSPYDSGIWGDIIHDRLWSLDEKLRQISNLGGVYAARKFSEEERLRWRNEHAPDKRFKNVFTHKVLRLIGGFYYSGQKKIPE